jgi:hypothetical protein
MSFTVSFTVSLILLRDRARDLEFVVRKPSEP